MRLIGLADIDLEYSNVAASTESEYSSSTTYAVDDVVKVSYESDGTTERTPVETYISLASSNLGNYPPDNPTKWSLQGATNRWKMFDGYTNTQTENSTSIEFEIDSSNCDAVGFFNMVASELQLAQIVNDEKITDGDCSSDSFTKGTGWSYDSTNEEYDCDGSQTSGTRLYQDLGTNIAEGHYYRVTFTVKNYSAGSITGIVGYADGGSVGYGSFVWANGRYSQIIQAGSGSMTGVSATADFAGSVDDISVKRVSNHDTINLLTMAGAGWWYYFFTDAEYTNKYIWDFTRYSDSTLWAKISYSGSTAECGIVAIGSQKEIGLSQYGARVGFIDYSKKDTDDLGRTYLNQGNYADEAEITGWLYNTQIDAVMKAIIAVRGEAVILDANNSEGDTTYESLQIYGFFQEPYITIPGPVVSKISIDYKGLI